MVKDEKILETYREIENMKVTQTELAKLVLGMIPFINKIEKKWLGTPEEEEKDDEEEKKKENNENLKNTNLEILENQKNLKNLKNLNYESAPNLNFKNNDFLKNTVKDVDTKKNNYNILDTKNSNDNKKIIKLKKIKNKNQKMDIDKIEVFNSWNLIDIDDLNQSAAIVANQFKEKGNKIFNETFNPDIIKNNCDIFTKEVVNEMTFKAKREIEEKMQENINRTIGKIKEFKDEKVKEIKEDKNFIMNIINELKLEPFINKLEKTKEEILTIKESMKKEIEYNNNKQKELIDELKNIYNSDKNEIKKLREDIIIELNKKDKEITNINEVIFNTNNKMTNINNSIEELYSRDNIKNNNIEEVIKNLKNLNENGDNLARYNIELINNNITEINKNIMNIIEQLKIKVDKNDNERINKLIEENKKISLEKNIEEKIMSLRNEIKEAKNIKIEEIFTVFKKTKEQEESQKIIRQNKEKELNDKWEIFSKDILKKLNNLEEVNNEKFKILNETINGRKIISEIILEKNDKNTSNDYKDLLNELKVKINRIEDKIERNQERMSIIEAKCLNQENLLMMINKNQNYEKKIEINPRIESKINTSDKESKDNNNKKYYSELNEIEEQIKGKIKKMNLEMEENIENIKKEIKRIKKEIEEEYNEKLNRTKKNLERNLEELKNEESEKKKEIKNEINEINIKYNNIKEWKEEILKGKEMKEKIEELQVKEIENMKLDIKKLEMIINVPKKPKEEEEKKDLKERKLNEPEKENLKKEIEDIKKEIEEIKNKEVKENTKAEKIIMKEKNDNYCTEKDCSYCRNIEKNLNEQIEVLGKIVENIETMAKQIKTLESNLSEIEGRNILEKENLSEKEKEKKKEENKSKKENEEKISNILNRLNKIEQEKFKKMDKEDKTIEKFNTEIKNLKMLDEIYNKGKNLNIYDVKNTNELNKKLIKENYKKNNVYRIYETKKIEEIIIKFFNNLGNLFETQIQEHETKKEGVIVKKKKIIGIRKYQDIYIRRNKNKNSKNKIIRINEVKKRVIWKIETDNKERDYELIKNETGDLCIYDIKNNENIKKYCGYCLSEDHEKNKCLKIVNYVNNLNNNWNNEEIKENVCNLCGCMHKMTSLNCVAKFNCEYINKILEIVYYIITDNNLSFEHEELIRRKEKKYEVYVNKIIDILNENYENIINKIENNKEENNIWFNSISNINKFINDGYREWNYINKINDINSIKSLGLVIKKKDIKAVMINFLKNKEYMKYNFKMDKNEIIYNNKIKKVSIKITDKELEKMYWNILNINLVKRINEIIKKENKEINIYINEKNNLFKKIFNKNFTSNKLKYGALNNMIIKKEMVNQLAKVKDCKNKEKYREKLSREIRLLENKKIKEINKEKIIEYEIAKDWSESDDEVELVEEENKVVFKMDNEKLKENLEQKESKEQKEFKKEEIDNKDLIINNFKKKLNSSMDLLSNKSDQKKSISMTEKIIMDNFIENKSTKTKEDILKKEAKIDKEENEIEEQDLEDINKYIEEQENKEREDQEEKKNTNFKKKEEDEDIDTRSKKE